MTEGDALQGSAGHTEATTRGARREAPGGDLLPGLPRALTSALLAESNESTSPKAGQTRGIFVFTLCSVTSPLDYSENPYSHSNHTPPNSPPILSIASSCMVGSTCP
jgi:hypothetical protein